MSNEVPEGWSVSNVSLVAQILDSKRVPLNADQRREMKGSVPYYGANGIVDYVNGYIYNEKLVLMAEDGGHFDEYRTRPICQLIDGPSWINNHAHVIRPTKAHIEYFYYWFVHRNIGEHIKGGTRSKLNQKDLRKLPIILPPLSEQKKIAEILTSVDEAIAATEALIAQTRRVKLGVLTHLLTRGIGHTRFKQTEIGEIPDGWEIRKLGELTDFVNGRGFKPHEWGTTGLPIIRIQNLNGNSEFNYFDGPYNPKIRVKAGDLLFAWSGSRGTSFGPHVWQGADGLLNYHTWKLDLVNPEDRDFIYHTLVFLTSLIEKDSHGASALVHMQKKNIVDYIVAYPGRDERERIVDQLSSIDESNAAAEFELSCLYSTKFALMSELLTGRKRVSLP